MSTGIQCASVEKYNYKNLGWVRSWALGGTMYNCRCTIVSAEKRATEDQRYREKMYRFMLQVKQNIDCFNVKNHHLVQRKKWFFLQANRAVIEIWQVRIVSAIQRENTRRDQQKDSIEQYLTRKPWKKRHHWQITREPSYDANPTYKQTLYISISPKTNKSNWIFFEAPQNQTDSNPKPGIEFDGEVFKII
jgi:hypothetical protein